ncbi:permease-like cell division protein FtsX [Pleionea litopenaei]|uniref:Cell division protein FtsX n=1 Tax=Pleionea litopenaei TaxID=3070815 RepID=A0AA51RR82_9GAMM|nr:permease-like cell division protein FtsX [Pleionea sp. HL-JVS1]WMS85984.1 permease-like cell division protein FtsX [Pleionea sp. HL-JVS1]
MTPSKDTLTKGAQLSTGSTIGSRLAMGFRQHGLECRKGLSELFRTPLSSLMTIAVLAIALALPAGFHVFLKNAQAVSSGWDNATQISLFLKPQLTSQQTTRLTSDLEASSKISAVAFISKEQGLQEFQSLSGFGDALTMLEDNPLPDTLVVTPTAAFSSPEASAELVAELQAIPEVELAQLDLQWVRKLYSMMDIAERAVSALGVLLGLAVLLIVGNTIRLAIQNKREEIQIIKLVGATDAFIRRPFLYAGLWYGILAGLISWILVNSSVFWLKEPVRNLAGLYESQFRLSGLGFVEALQLIAFATGLGLLGSWLSVGRHIREIEPT